MTGVYTGRRLPRAGLRLTPIKRGNRPVDFGTRELCRFPDSPGTIKVLVLFAEDQVVQREHARACRGER